MIGIYDSGVGGLGIFKEVKSMLPQESITYYADSAYFPYGDKSHEEVRERTLHCLHELAKTCNIIVLGCNTASVNDLDHYRSMISQPIIGVVPVIKTAAQITESKHILLMATAGTINADYTDRLISAFADGASVDKVACSGLADAVEYEDTQQQLELVTKALANKGDADVVILGSTHYTIIKGLIQHAAGPTVKVLDSNEAVARHVLRVMRAENLEQPQTTPEYIFHSTKDSTDFAEKAERILKTI